MRVETLSCYGRTYKDLWHRTQDVRHKRDYLSSRSTSIAKPTKLTVVIIRLSTRPRVVTRRYEQRNDTGPAVVDECDATGVWPDYWLQATLEAHLILNQFDTALSHYAAAAKLGEGNYTELDSTRQQALMIIASRELGIELANRYGDFWCHL